MGQLVHFWSCDITKHGIYMIGYIPAIFKDKDFWFRPNNSLKLCAEDLTMFWDIMCISGPMTGHQLFYKKVPIHLKRFLLDIYLQLCINRNVHLFFHLAPLTLDDL